MDVSFTPLSCPRSSTLAQDKGVRVFFKSKHEESEYAGEMSEAQLGEWARDMCSPLVREITFENGEELTEEGLPFLILFYDPNRPEA